MEGVMEKLGCTAFYIRRELQSGMNDRLRTEICRCHMSDEKQPLVSSASSTLRTGTWQLTFSLLDIYAWHYRLPLEALKHCSLMR